MIFAKEYKYETAYRSVNTLIQPKKYRAIRASSPDALGDQKSEVLENGAAIPKKENRTGLPDQLKTGLENLSGIPMDHVRVHYNSSKPAKLEAQAYTQGANIQVGPGQESYLPHEGWHVVQQMQGRVQATSQAAGLPVNDAPELEKEADEQGARALNPIHSINRLGDNIGDTLSNTINEKGTSTIQRGKRKRKPQKKDQESNKEKKVQSPDLSIEPDENDTNFEKKDEEPQEISPLKGNVTPEKKDKQEPETEEVRFNNDNEKWDSTFWHQFEIFKNVNCDLETITKREQKIKQRKQKEKEAEEEEKQKAKLEGKKWNKKKYKKKSTTQSVSVKYKDKEDKSYEGKTSGELHGELNAINKAYKKNKDDESSYSSIIEDLELKMKDVSTPSCLFCTVIQDLLGVQEITEKRIPVSSSSGKGYGLPPELYQDQTLMEKLIGPDVYQSLAQDAKLSNKKLQPVLREYWTDYTTYILPELNKEKFQKELEKKCKPK